jgi:hypothetical protein
MRLSEREGIHDGLGVQAVESFGGLIEMVAIAAMSGAVALR